MRVSCQLISFYLFFVLIPVIGVQAGGKNNYNSPKKLEADSVSFFPTEESGLMFEKAFSYRKTDSSYIDIIQLKNLTGLAHAIQFRIQINKAEDDSTILIFEGFDKGSDINDPNWILNYNIVEGTKLSNGASKIDVMVLIYHLNQNNGLQPGNYNELFKISYRIGHFPLSEDSVKSSMKIMNAGGHR